MTSQSWPGKNLANDWILFYHNRTRMPAFGTAVQETAALQDIVGLNVATKRLKLIQFGIRLATLGVRSWQ